MTAPQDDPGPVRLTAWVDGRVQGVGFRYWVRMRATALGLTGSAANLDNGQVEVIAEGPAHEVRALLADLTGGETPGRVTRVTPRWGRPQGQSQGFTERLFRYPDAAHYGVSPAGGYRRPQVTPMVTQRGPLRCPYSACKVNNRGYVGTQLDQPSP